MPSIEWPKPRGKYQTSPGLKSAICEWPLGSIVVTRHLPLSTYAHSAALACQCSSRKPPGASDISTPASFSETGNSATVASLAQPPSQRFWATAPSWKRNEGSCAPASTGGVGPNGGCPSARPSVAAATATAPPAAAAPSRFRRENSVIVSLPGSAACENHPRLIEYIPAIMTRACVHARQEPFARQR